MCRKAGNCVAGKVRACGERGGGRSRGAAGARRQERPGRDAGQRTVHSVHSACFWPGLTQYCS